MGFELGRLVREAAGGLGSLVAEKARDLRRRAHAQAGRVWRDVGEILRVQLATALESRRDPSRNIAVNQAVGPRTHVLIETMAEVLALSGYRSVHADVAGCPAPQLVQGTVRSHRPSLTAVGGGRPVLVDVYLPGETDDEEQVSRWQLFASAAVQSDGEFHVVVPSWIEGSTGRAWVHALADAAGMTVTKVWEV
jgi:hypothetical protein